MKKKTGKVILTVLIAAAAICLAGVVIITTKNHTSTENNTSEKKEFEVSETPKPVIKDFAALNDIDTYSNVSKYFTYGTTLCIEGTFSDEAFADISDISIILRQAYTESDGSIVSDDLYEFAAYYKADSNVINYTSYEDINAGIPLENIKDGEYCLLLKVTYLTETVKYISLMTDSVTEEICYYTITNNGINRRIDIGFNNFNEKSYLAFNVTQSSLPDDVYDIVIDAGHGGNDSGAVNGNFHEADITLDYALDLKTALETAGFKVKLTRDGTESPDTWMAYTMYDEDGRVNVAGASNAKYCLSVHLNSNAQYVSKGGLQIYVSYRADSSFAKILASNISSSSGIELSSMKAYKLEDGIYSRAFSQADINSSIAEATAGGLEPYDLTTDTDYYYMIRELGGIATNAYVDGRKKEYGTNLYRDSIQGIESYILELGFISIDDDLQLILNHKDEYIQGIVDSFIEITNPRQ